MNDFCKIIGKASNDKINVRVIEFNNKDEKSYAMYFYKEEQLIFENYYMERDIKQLKQDFINMQEVYFGSVIQKYFVFDGEGILKVAT